MGEEVVIVRNKYEIELKINQHNKEHFSKVKSTKAHEDKTYKRINENKNSNAIMDVELKRDEEGVHQFLQLLKRPKGLTPDEEDYMEINEWKQVVRKSKKVVDSQCFQ